MNIGLLEISKSSSAETEFSFFFGIFSVGFRFFFVFFAIPTSVSVFKISRYRFRFSVTDSALIRTHWSGSDYLVNFSYLMLSTSEGKQTPHMRWLCGPDVVLLLICFRLIILYIFWWVYNRHVMDLTDF